MSAGPQGITQHIARFVHRTHFSDLPPSTVELAKFCILDALACSLGGSRTKIGDILNAYIRQVGGTEEATVLGMGRRATAEGAALVNGATARCLELDDTHALSGMHPGAVVVSAALAMAETTGAPGKELITAVALGYEVALKVALATMPSLSQRGFHPTGVCGILGAAVAAGKLLGLDEEGYLNLLGTSATSAGGLFQFEAEGGDTFMSSTLNAGRSASLGVASARLTSLGLKGPRRVLEGERGFARAFSDGLKAEALQGLGAPFEIERLDFTIYACCRHTRSAVEAALSLLKEGAISPQDIQAVEVRTYLAATAESCRRQEVRDEYDAIFSIPYGLAMASLRGRVSGEEFSEDLVHDPQVRELVQRVAVKPDAEMTRRYPASSPARVVVRTKAGDVLEGQVEHPKGSRGNPLSLQERRQKLRDLAADAMTPTEADRMADFLLDLERQPSTRGLPALLHPGVAGERV